MSGIGESLSFANSHGSHGVAQRVAEGATSQIAVAVHIHRVPVNLNKK
jgi:hypothetical protein